MSFDAISRLREAGWIAPEPSRGYPSTGSPYIGRPTGATKLTSLTEEQATIASQLSDYLKNALTPTEGTTAQQDMLSEAMASYRQTLTPKTPEEIDAWYSQYVAPLEERTMQQTILPGVREAYAGTEMMAGSPRMEAESKAWQQYGAERLGRVGQAVWDEQGRAQTALGMLPGMIGSQLAGSKFASPEWQAAQNFLGESMFSYLLPPGSTTTTQKSPSNVAQNVTAGAALYDALKCCFIVLQGEGTLTNNVRVVRDRIIHTLQNNHIAIGYRKLARRLVPLMKQFEPIQLLIRLCMTKPISIFSNLAIKRSRSRLALLPIATFWLSVFGWLGGKLSNPFRTVKVLMGKEVENA